MCYSARVQADYRKFTRDFGAQLSLEEFTRLWLREAGAKVRVPKALEVAFLDDSDPSVSEIAGAIRAGYAAQESELQQEVFKQRKRLADAERVLAIKPTKKAADDARIAPTKIAYALGKLEDLARVEPVPRDSRIFPGWYVPVLVVEDGERVIKPMRYQCRPAGKPASYDIKYPGTYNARRDNLRGFWKGQYGYTHGLVVIDSFFENVKRHNLERRNLAPGESEQNVILEFQPNVREPMVAACLWSRWSAPGEGDLLSFALITDEPPPEVAAAGHDRCIIPIKPEHVDAWLNPDPTNLAEVDAILDDRVRYVFEHRMAA
jgi:putative SOS response-associated peptidase YedK